MATIEEAIERTKDEIERASDHLRSVCERMDTQKQFLQQNRQSAAADPTMTQPRPRAQDARGKPQRPHAPLENLRAEKVEIDKEIAL